MAQISRGKINRTAPSARQMPRDIGALAASSQPGPSGVILNVSLHAQSGRSRLSSWRATPKIVESQRITSVSATSPRRSRYREQNSTRARWASLRSPRALKLAASQGPEDACQPVAKVAGGLIEAWATRHGGRCLIGPACARRSVGARQSVERTEAEERVISVYPFQGVGFLCPHQLALQKFERNRPKMRIQV